MSYTVPIAIFLLSQTSWLVSFTLTRFNLMKDQLSVFIAGVSCLAIVTVGPFLIFRRSFKCVDPLMCVISVFAWTSMIDLSIGLELDGYISNFMGFYFAEGEPYLKTAHGTAINYWDGTVHFALYLAMIALYSKGKSYRNVGLYWVGTILNSMIVLLQGGVAGNNPFKLSILLNIPYVLLPLLAAFKFLHDRPPQARTFVTFQSINRRPIDLLFVVYFIAAICVAIFRGMTVLGGNAETMKEYHRIYEPYLLDPTNFPKFQILTYGYFFFAYYLSAVYGLLYPGQHWMADWSIIHAGAAAQAQFTYIFGSCHHRTPISLQCPKEGAPALVFWTINLTLLLVPHLFTWWCSKDVESFGNTHTLEGSKPVVEQTNGTTKIKSGKIA
uniref:EXPERA domain-containing protein n=2 Tax=Arion vulgaris TaxID=1028688 RepID=A0A0B7AEA7_9EUPU